MLHILLVLVLDIALTKLLVLVLVMVLTKPLVLRTESTAGVGAVFGPKKHDLTSITPAVGLVAMISYGLRRAPRLAA